MRWQGIAYRAHDPRFAFAPTSGEGAAAKGGRFNPVGTPALYLALTLEGMFVEMGHGFGHRLEPLTVCSYDIDVDDLVDLRDERSRGQAGVTLSEMASPWALDRAEGRIPASWRLSRRLVDEGAAGILVPSFARGARSDMANLVLWRWGPDRPHKVTVHDPSGRLPKDISSWSADES
ncbi:RES family NAD+ phosphorylase [Afifella sp. YEN Y35]|uniref:RES family NAD+ phosphorylase n=1 Tax=Afifella sp. YEN Y35 TaxID=3388337 RepID=UPI0039DF7828